MGPDGQPPLIGVTTSEVRPLVYPHRKPRLEPPRPEMALGMSYMRALDGVGALPVVLPPLGTHTVAPLVERLDGICLSGGPDLDPAEYGEARDPQLGPTWRDLDRFELELARRADERGLPVLGICRGAQTLNVARGGSLCQHVGPEGDGRFAHRQSVAGERPTHAVEIEPQSALARALGATELEVNSFHHQAVRDLGRDLRAVAWAPDGVVEGIEDPTRPLYLGVQWHAELHGDREAERRLFTTFVRAAVAHRERRVLSING